MNYQESAKLQARVESHLSHLWDTYPKQMLGHGVRVGKGGKPEVYVTLLNTGPIASKDIQNEVNGVRVMYVYSPPAYDENTPFEHELKAFQCYECKFEFVVVGLNQYEDWKEEPACPLCSDRDYITKINCLDVRLTDKGAKKIEISKDIKPIPYGLSPALGG